MDMATAARVVRNPGPPDRARFAKLEQLLEEHRSALQARRQLLRDSVPAETPEVKDVEEHSGDVAELGVGVAVLELTSRMVQGIELALDRLKAGTYGTCAECGAPIALARLKALPFAERCRDCQEARDLAAAARGHDKRGAKAESPPSPRLAGRRSGVRDGSLRA
jgi:DnaK suppressor protein